MDRLPWHRARTSTLNDSTKEGVWVAFHQAWSLNAPLMCKFLLSPENDLFVCPNGFSFGSIVSHLSTLPSYNWALAFGGLASWYLWSDVLLPLLHVTFVWSHLLRPLTSSCPAPAWISCGHRGHSWPLAHCIFCLCLLWSGALEFYPVWMLTLE